MGGVKLYKTGGIRQDGRQERRPAITIMTEILLRALGATLGAVALAWVGYRIAKLPGRWWFFGWSVPLLTLYAAALGLNSRWFSFVPPISWLTGGWSRWLVTGWCASMTLGTLITRLPRPSTRRALWWLCGIIILRTTTLPFLSPLLSNAELETMTTHVDGRGVCQQSTSYNCGPASSVTALRKLGFAAEEGQLGLLCGTTAINGTPDDLLAEGLRKQYGPQGLVVERRYVASADELRAWPTALAVIKYGIFVDHYVTVLGFKGDQIILGDPLTGEEVMPMADFLKTWHHVAILLKRE
jgi:hypothetical protein